MNAIATDTESYLISGVQKEPAAEVCHISLTPANLHSDTANYITVRNASVRHTLRHQRTHTHPFCTSGHCTGFYSSRKECVVYSTQAGWILKSCYMLPLRATGLGCTFSVACRHHAVVISGTQSVIKAWDGSLRGKRASAEKSKRNTFVLHWPGKFFVRTWPGHIGCLFNLHKNKKV